MDEFSKETKFTQEDLDLKVNFLGDTLTMNNNKTTS